MDQLTDAIQRYYDDGAQEYDAWCKRWMNIDRSVLVPHVRHARRVIELGCGTGLNLLYIGSDTEYIGLDVSGQMLKRARHRLQGNSGHLVHTPVFDYAGNVDCDVALATFFFSVDPHWERDMKRCVSHIGPRGKMVIIDQYCRDPGILDRAYGGLGYMACRCNPSRDLPRVLEESGMSIIQEESLGVYGRHCRREVRMLVGLKKKEN